MLSKSRVSCWCLSFIFKMKHWRNLLTPVIYKVLFLKGGYCKSLQKCHFLIIVVKKRKENTCSANIKISKNKNLLIPILQLARFPHHYHLLIFYDAASMWFLDRYSKTITNDERSTDMALNCQINNDVSPKNAIFTKQRNKNTNQCNFHSEQQQK